MKKPMSLWVRTTVEGRVIWSAGQKDWLRTPDSLQDEVFYDVELKGEIEVPDEKAV
jgi:hypothetical protein